jgi:hypothetical protein
MTVFNKPYIESAVIVHADGFRPSKEGARVHFKDGTPTVQDGPFGFDNLVAGYWIIKAASLEEALDFAKKVPFKDGAVEVRRIQGIEDFGENLSEEMKEMMKKPDASDV